MKFLSELYDHTAIQVLTEEMNGEENMYIEGVFMQGNVLNGNRRIYPADILEAATKSYISTHVNQGRAVGELGHPESPNVNLDRISHLIESLTMVGSNVHGKAKIAPTPCGQIAQGLLKTGVKLGVSSRGLGTVVEDNSGRNIVQNDFMLTTAADIVFDPSAPDAFVNSLMENLDWVFDPFTKEWQRTQQLEQIQENLNKGKTSYDDAVTQLRTFIQSL